MKTLALLATLFLSTAALADGQAGINAASGDFAVDLYKKLAAANPAQNMIYSPISVEIALAMTAAGANGTTLDEMKSVLKAGDEPTSFFANVQRQVQDEDLSIANKIWVQKGFQLETPFVSALANSFGPVVENISFMQPKVAEATINEWVKEATKEKIPELLKDVLTADTRVVLTNAVYFKKNWVTQFDPAKSRLAHFYSGANAVSSGQVTLMSVKSNFRYIYDREEDYTAIELPYDGGNTVMLAILPRQAHAANESNLENLKAFESTLTTAKLNGILESMYEMDNVELQLPKFSTRTPTSLATALQELGMPTAFDSRAANFTRINRSGGLFIQDVIHEAFIDVNESGTEAAGATAVVIGERSAPRRMDFIANRPFIYALISKADDGKGTVLFMGRYVAPSAQ